MCVCVCACMGVCVSHLEQMHACVFASSWLCVCACIFVCIAVCTCQCVHIYVCVRVSVCACGESKAPGSCAFDELNEPGRRTHSCLLHLHVQPFIWAAVGTGGGEAGPGPGCDPIPEKRQALEMLPQASGHSMQMSHSELHRAAVSADPGAGGMKWRDTPKFLHGVKALCWGSGRSGDSVLAPHLVPPYFLLNTSVDTATRKFFPCVWLCFKSTQMVRYPGSPRSPAALKVVIYIYHDHPLSTATATA